MVDDVCLIPISKDTIPSALIADTANCNGTSLSFNAPTGYNNYTWTTIGGTILSTNNNYNTTFLGLNQYVLYAEDTSICPAQVIVDTINVIGTNCGSIIISDTSICQGDSVLLIASGSTSGYTWVDSTSFTPVLSIDSFYMASPNTSTTYAIYNATDTAYATVTVFNSSSFNNVLNECEGFSITVNGNTYDSTGVYSDTLVGANAHGCDSILTTNLTIIPNSLGSLILSECQGYSIVINGNTYNATGVYIDTLLSSAASGCDSILTTNLTILPNAVNNITLNECNGFSITINGNTYTTTGNYSDTITLGTTNGCDSIVNLSLNIIPAATFNQSFTECQGFSITVNGNTYNATGIYIDTLFSASSNGCDSIITTNLTIVQPGNAGLDASIALCSGDTLLDLFTLLTGADLGGTWSPALTSSTGIFDPQIDPAGMYNYIVTNSPCPADSAVVTVNIIPSPTVDITTIDDNCEQSSGAISLSTTSGTPQFTFNWNTGDTDSSIANLGVGTYNVIVSDSSGCTNNYSINVEDYQVDCEYHVYLPNVFSPNGDNENDVLYVRGKGIKTIQLVIYNRWGNKVFETTDINQGWDGTYRGQKQGSAVFVYYLEATFVNGATTKDKGNVSIVK
jgi:gliding motility-associated-like protein